MVHLSSLRSMATTMLENEPTDNGEPKKNEASQAPLGSNADLSAKEEDVMVADIRFDDTAFEEGSLAYYQYVETDTIQSQVPGTDDLPSLLNDDDTSTTTADYAPVKSLNELEASDEKCGASEFEGDEVDDEDEDDFLLGPLHEFVAGQDRTNPDAVDSFLAKELTALSCEEREAVYMDMHGVTARIQETPDLLSKSLADLEDYLQRKSKTVDEDLSDRDYPDDSYAYRKALAQDRDYVENASFRLMFLRADRFDIPATARRLHQHFRVKLHLFGEDLLCENIEQAHMRPEDLRAIHEGGGYDLPVRDTAGRLISVRFSQPTDVPLKSVLRKYFYEGMILAEDEENQRTGIVPISYLVAQPLTWQDLSRRQAMTKNAAFVINGLPLRLEATHFCSDSIVWRTVSALHKWGVSQPSRLRVKEHYGWNAQEIFFQLQTYGIPTQHFPVNSDGSLRKDLVVERFRKRRELEVFRREQSERQKGKEEAQKDARTDEDHDSKSTASEEDSNKSTTSTDETEPPCTRVGTPTRRDVLLGRGKAYYNHPGNIRLRSMVIERVDVYESTLNHKKKNVCMEIISLVKEKWNGRFLKEDRWGWIEVDDMTALKKISGVFRTLRSLRLKGKSCTTSSTSSKRTADALKKGKD